MGTSLLRSPPPTSDGRYMIIFYMMVVGWFGGAGTVETVERQVDLRYFRDGIPL